jgi:DnaK suppressor protein
MKAGDVRAALESKRARLLADMDRMTAPPADASNISFGKRVGEGTSYAVERLVQVELHDQMQVVLTDVTRALVKLDEGTYGTCDACGGDIAPARVEGLPWATLCVSCAAQR